MLHFLILLCYINTLTLWDIFVNIGTNFILTSILIAVILSIGTKIPIKKKPESNE